MRCREFIRQARDHVSCITHPVSMAHLALSFLGRFQVTLDGTPVTAFESDKVRALLAYLSVEASHPHRRGVLADLLWPERPERSARANLRHVLLKLRQAIGDRDASPPFLLIAHGTIQFNPASDHWLDVTVFSDLIEASQEHRHRCLEVCPVCIQRLSQAAELYGGNFLEGLCLHDSVAFEEWSSLIRERLHRQALEALYHLAAYHERRGEYDQARRYAVRQIELEPWREEAHRQLMRLLALSEQRSAALTQYETCRRVLAEELGVEPSRETTALYEQIKGVREKGKKGKGEKGDLAPPHLRASAPPHNLPAQLTSFVGREQELAQITERLSHPDYRLVTLVGPGGIGKTRLALAAAVQQVGMFQHGVWFVPLAGLGSPESLVPAIAGVLNLPLHGREEPKAQLLAYLREKEMLLVLDDFEHLLDGADLVLDILRSAPQVVILITSRQRLNLQAEYVIGVEGLTHPDFGFGISGLGFGIADCGFDLAENVNSKSEIRNPKWSAVQLFVERADRSTPGGFALSPEITPHVVQVCQLVEGMPLAIELAAALVDTYSCADIARSIQHDLDFLATTMRDVPPRHRSIRAVFESSWRLLSEAEQRTLAQCSVFQGGFTQHAALAVIGDQLPVSSEQLSVNSKQLSVNGDETDHCSPIADHCSLITDHCSLITDHCSLITDHCLPSLVDKSLLRWTASGRYEMHGLLRQFAAEKLETGDWRLETADVAPDAQSAICHPPSAIRLRHSRFYLAFVADRTRLLYGPESQKVVAEIQQEVGNVRQAWQWAATHADIEAIGRSLDGLSRYYLLAGPFQEGEAAFSKAADRMRALVEEAPRSGAGSRDVHVVLSKLLTEQARFLVEQGRCDEATATAQAAIRLAQTAQAIGPEAAGYLQWGHALWRQGDYEAARPRLEQALALARAAQRGPEPCPEAWSGPGLTEGLRQVEGGSLRNLGIVSFYLGDYVGARRYYEQALRICRKIGNRRGESAALNNLGIVSRRQGDYLGARAYYEQVLRIKHEIGDRQGEAITLNNLGSVCLYLGDYAGARAYYEQALRIKREIGDRRGEGVGLSNLSLLFHHLGEDEAAREYGQHALDIAREMSDRARQGSALTLLGHALAGLGRLAEAADAYRQALDLWRELGEHDRAMEALAGLARVAPAQGDPSTGSGQALTDALARVEEILSHLETSTPTTGAVLSPSKGSAHGLDGTLEPFRVYLTCYRVLRANRDSRAQGVLTTAYNLLQELAAKIGDEGLRRSFLENVVVHREIVREWVAVEKRGSVGRIGNSPVGQAC